MYRFVTLFLILSLFNNYIGCYFRYREHLGYGCKHHHSYHHHPNEDPSGNKETETFEEVLRKFVEADESLRKFCTNNMQVDPLITYGQDGCVLKYPLLDTKDFNVDAKITNKLLKLSVKKQNDDVLFTDVRVLPNILDFKRATWLESTGVLIITIPFKETLMSEHTLKCEDVDVDVLVIPKLPAIQLRSIY